MRNIRAGALRTPVFLGKPVITKDSAGGEALTWEERATWALIEPVGGREMLTGAIKDAIDCRITLRINPDFVPDARWRVRDPAYTRLYNLVSVLLLPKTGAAECLAKSSPGDSDGR